MTTPGKLVVAFGHRSGPDVIGPPPTPVGNPPTKLVSGLCSRSIVQAQGIFRNLIDGVVINEPTLTWAALQPSSGALNSTALSSLQSALDWCAANTGTSGKPLLVRLRILAGCYTPDWVKNAYGRMTWYANSGSEITGGTQSVNNSGFYTMTPDVAQWWQAGYLAAYDNFHSRLAAAFGGHPALTEVVVTAPTTQFAEPCVRQFGCLDNMQMALSKGWTRTLDTAAFVSAWNTHSTYWTPYGIATNTSFNPVDDIKTITASPGITYRVNTGITLALQSQMTGILSRMSMWGNDSLEAPLPQRGQPYQLMYQTQAAARAATSPFPQAITYQSATLPKIQADGAANGQQTTVVNTIELALSQGATGLELPVGCQSTSAGTGNYISPAAAAAYNTRFRANTVPLELTAP